MREVDRTFTPGEQITDTPANGQFIYIDKAPGVVRVSVNTQAGKRIYELTERGQVIVPEGEEFTKFDVKNMSDLTGEIVIFTGYGTYVPSNEYQKVVIEGAELTIDNLKVNFDGTQPVNVTNTVPVTISDPVTVTVADSLPVSVAETLAVSAAETLPVDVQNTVSIDDSEAIKVQMVSYGEAYVAVDGGEHFISSGTYSIAASAARSMIFIQNDSSNSNPMKVNGFLKLDPGGHLIADAKGASFTVTGTDGDQVNVGERVDGTK